MKKLFALVSVSVLLLQVSSIGTGSAQISPQRQQSDQETDKSAGTYNRSGIAKYKSRDFQGAIADYNMAIRMNPQYASAYSNRCLAKSGLGDKNGAIADCNIAIRINPQLPYAYANRGVAKLGLGDKNGAVADWTEASELYRQQGKMSSYQAMLARIDKINTAISDEGLQSNWTSTSQLKDMKPTDSYYLAVQSLTERYGVMYAYSDDKFHAQRPLTRGQLVSFLNSSLDRLNDLIAVSNADSRVPAKFGYCSDKPLAFNEIFCLNYSLYKNNVNSVSQIKDVPPTHVYVTNLQSLIERYGIKIIDADNYFRSTQPVTKKEFYALMNGIFNYRPVGSQSVSKAPLTRGEFATVLNDVLDSANEKIALLGKNN
jgi:S-layer homology domain